MTYEIRDDPDDLPIICATEAEARRRGRRRAARIGQPVLIDEMDDRHGERFIAPSNSTPCPASHLARGASLVSQVGRG